jgi:G3E family GTPase
VLLETTGLADPGPIASMFWLDPALESLVITNNVKVKLDGIVTVVDAKFISQYLDKPTKPDTINEAAK